MIFIDRKTQFYNVLHFPLTDILISMYVCNSTYSKIYKAQQKAKNNKKSPRHS